MRMDRKEEGKTHNHESAGPLGSHCIFCIFIRERQIPVSACEAAKGADEGEEDEEEGDVCAEGAYEEDEADESYICMIAIRVLSILPCGRRVTKVQPTHKNEEERKASIEPRRLLTQRISRIAVLPCHLCRIGDISAVCVEGGDESAAEGEPEGACSGGKGSS